MQRRCWLLLLAFIFFLIVPEISAVGIAPASTELTFNTNETATVTFYAVNSEDHTIEVKVYADGELAQYVSFDQDKITLAPNEVKPFQVYIQLPDILPAGHHVVTIGLTEDTGDISGTGMHGFVAAESRVDINNLLGPIALEINLNVANISTPGQTINFITNISNPTSLDIQIADGDIRVYNPQDNEIDSLILEPINILAGEEKEIVTPWQTSGFSAGAYKAIATFSYEDTSSQDEVYFQIGQPSIEIINMAINVGKDSTKFVITLQNKWNTKLTDVHIELKILDKNNNNQVGSVKSSAAYIEANQKAEFTVYWNDLYDYTKHDVEITVHYAGLTSSKKIYAKDEPQILGKAVSEKTNILEDVLEEIPLTYFMIGILLLVMAVLIIMYIKPPKAIRRYAPRYYWRYNY